MTLRLNKYLSQMGIGSRRACDKIINERRVTVNREVAAPGRQVEPENDTITIDGKPLTYKKTTFKYYKYYKPVGMLCSNSDPHHKNTLQRVLNQFDERLFSIGRLDLDSEGLLILTNDGDLTLKLSHPRFGSDKIYLVRLDSDLSEAQKRNFATGVDLEEDGITRPCRIKKHPALKHTYTVTLKEGKKRQIRMMMRKLGKQVFMLKRVQLAGISLGQLKSGEWAELTMKESQRIKRLKKRHQSTDSNSSTTGSANRKPRRQFPAPKRVRPRNKRPNRSNP